MDHPEKAPGESQERLSPSEETEETASSEALPASGKKIARNQDPVGGISGRPRGENFIEDSSMEARPPPEDLFDEVRIHGERIPPGASRISLPQIGICESGGTSASMIPHQEESEDERNERDSDEIRVEFTWPTS